MLFDRFRSGNINVPVSIGSETSCYVKRIGAAVRQILLREGRRDLKLVSWPQIVPVGQGPGRGTAEVDHVRPDLRFQRQQISAVPWWEIPTLMLALIPGAKTPSAN